MTDVALSFDPETMEVDLVLDHMMLTQPEQISVPGSNGGQNSMPAANWRQAAYWVGAAGVASAANDATGIDNVPNSAVTIYDNDPAMAASMSTPMATIAADLSSHVYAVDVAANMTYIPMIRVRISGGTAKNFDVALDTSNGQKSDDSVPCIIEPTPWGWRVIIQAINNGTNTAIRCIVFPSVRQTLNGVPDQTLQAGCTIDWPVANLYSDIYSRRIAGGVTEPFEHFFAGAGQSPAAINVGGLAALRTGILKAGNKVEVDSSIYQLQADADSDIFGRATLQLDRALQTSPADQTLITYMQDVEVQGPADFKAGGELYNAVLLSLLIHRRAAADDIIPDGWNDRRGYWAAIFDGYEWGSRHWLLSREKQLPNVLNAFREFAEEALQWLVDDGVAASIDVTSEWVRTGMLGLVIVIFRPDGRSEQHKFAFAWESL